MIKIANIVFISLFSLLFLCNCSEANPLIGKWHVESIKADDLITQVSIDRYKSIQPQTIIFYENEIGVIIQDKESKKKISYKKENDKTWSFSVDEKDWRQMIFEDNDTVIMKEKKDGGAEFKYTLKRIK